MSPTFKLLGRTLLAGGIAASMTACSEDLPTGPADKTGAGGVQPDVSIQAAPANDDIANATDVTAIPFTDAISTTDATTDPDDPFCVSDERERTVWYEYTPAEDLRITANTAGSDYDTGLSLYTGAPGALSQLDCNDDAGGTLQSSVTFDAQAGTTYFFMVEAYPGTGGGNLVFNVLEALPPPPPLEIGLTIDPTGRVQPSTGVATISGTVTCSQPVSMEVFGELRQRLGRSLLRGSFDAVVDCDGGTTWRADVHLDNGLFVAGRAEVSALAEAEDPGTGDFVIARASAAVRLRGK